MVLLIRAIAIAIVAVVVVVVVGALGVIIVLGHFHVSLLAWLSAFLLVRQKPIRR